MFSLNLYTLSFPMHKSFDNTFYMQIWEDRRHFCECCNNPLFAPRKFNFHHILEKREKDNKANEYTMYRHCKWNIMLLCWQCHDAYERNPAIIRLEPIRLLRSQLLIVHSQIQDGTVEWDHDAYWYDTQDISNIKNYIPCLKLSLS